MSYADTVHKKAVKRAAKWTKPATGVFQDYYRPAFEGAYNAAQRMGEIPSFYSQYAQAQRNQANTFNRMGMSGSGEAIAAQGQLDRNFAEARANAEGQALQNRFGALSSLAGQAYQGGMSAAGLRMNAQNQWANYLGAAEAQNRAAKHASRAANAAGLGQAIGGIADLGLAAATGGAYAPIAGITGGISGMMSGAKAYGSALYQNALSGYGTSRYDPYADFYG